MVLFVDGEAKSDSTSLDFDKLLKLRQISSKFAGENARELFPRDKYLYVGEHEMAAVTQDDPNIEFIGSEDATTCHIIILREKNLLTCGVVHIVSDENDQLRDLVEHMKQILNLQSLQLDVFIVGGFSDDRGLSEDITQAVMNYMIQEQNVEFHLQLFCAGPINTVIKDGIRWPIHYGCAIRIESGEVFPAKFVDHGPDPDIRALGHWFQYEGVLNLYDNKTSTLFIPHFNFTPDSSASRWLEVTDDYLLSKRSTSPLVEPSHFCENMRQVYRRMLTDPEPLKTIFKGGKGRRYRRCESSGDWKLVDPHLYENGLIESSQIRQPSFNIKDFVASVKKL